MIAGIDEVGRGCLAGAVVAAAVILNPDKPIAGLVDSKAITATKREQLAILIYQRARAWGIGRAEVSEIDQLNILQASLLAMTRAYYAMGVTPDAVKVDGIHYPSIPCSGETIVKGDQSIAEISAASIIAKVARDSEMKVLDALLPGYEFSRHKGYPTRIHLQRLQTLGVSEYHRRSYAPVKKILDNYNQPME